MAARSTATPPAQQPAWASRLAARTVHGTPAANGATGSFHETASIQHRQQMTHRDFAYGCGTWCVVGWIGGRARRAPVALWIGKCWLMARPGPSCVHLASTCVSSSVGVLYGKAAALDRAFLRLTAT